MKISQNCNSFVSSFISSESRWLQSNVVHCAKPSSDNMISIDNNKKHREGMDGVYPRNEGHRCMRNECHSCDFVFRTVVDRVTDSWLDQIIIINFSNSLLFTICRLIHLLLIITNTRTQTTWRNQIPFYTFRIILFEFCVYVLFAWVFVCR